MDNNQKKYKQNSYINTSQNGGVLSIIFNKTQCTINKAKLTFALIFRMISKHILYNPI